MGNCICMSVFAWWSRRTENYLSIYIYICMPGGVGGGDVGVTGELYS